MGNSFRFLTELQLRTLKCWVLGGITKIPEVILARCFITVLINVVNVRIPGLVDARVVGRSLQLGGGLALRSGIWACPYSNRLPGGLNVPITGNYGSLSFSFTLVLTDQTTHRLTARKPLRRHSFVKMEARPPFLPTNPPPTAFPETLPVA